MAQLSAFSLLTCQLAISSKNKKKYLDKGNGWILSKTRQDLEKRDYKLFNKSFRHVILFAQEVFIQLYSKLLH